VGNGRRFRRYPALGTGHCIQPPEGQDDKAALDFLNGACKTGLENLKKTLEARDGQAVR